MTTRDRVMAHLKSSRYQPVKVRALARFFDVEDDDYPRFRRLIRELVDEGQIVVGTGRQLQAAPEQTRAPKGTFTGIFRRHPKGFGFIEPDDPEMTDDVFVPPGETLDAITGDHIAARRVKRHGRRPGQLPYVGRIVKIIERGQTQFVGTYRLRGKSGMVKPDGGLLTEDIAVPDASASGAKAGDKVVFELLQYPAQDQQAQAVIVEVLGQRGDPGVDTLAVIRQFGLRDDFPDEVLDAARAAVERFTDEEIQRRTDLRDLLTITIDPESARDYDDAITLQQREGGVVRLGVHIADVSHFVRPGEALDDEAAKRATSVYLPTVVLPMLPELLSNGICSLQEGQDRLTKSVFIDIDAEGRPGKTAMANAIIRNKKRLTYEQVNQVIDEGRNDVVSPEVLQMLHEMNALARRILHRRRRDGYLELDLPDVDLEFDEQGNVVDAHPEDQSFSHKIIEMFMVEANEAVARYLARRNVPAIRRIHPAPSEEKLGELGGFLRSCGHEIKKPGNRHALQQLLKDTRNTPEAYPVHMAVLRSMQQAKYAVEDEEHWALASSCYCHFTSPIRRYPDLVVHRSLAALEGWDGSSPGSGRKRGGRRKRAADAGPSDEQALAQTAAHCSRNERRAEAAERELTKVKVLTLMEKHVGDQYTGIVSGVAEYGLFVELPKYLIEGLVHASDLRDDDYDFSQRSYSLTGKRSGRRIRLGDTIRVVIAGVDIPRRQLDLSPAPESVHGTPPVKGPKKFASAGGGSARGDRSSRSKQGRRNKGRRRR